MQIYPLATAPTAVKGLVYPRRRITLCGRTAAALSWRYAAEVALITRIERGQLRSRLPMVGFLAVVAMVASRGPGR